MNTPVKTRYGAAAQAFHWISALAVVLAWGTGLLRDSLPKGPIRSADMFTHVSAGEIVALLLVLRLVWRFVDAPPPALVSGRGRLADMAPKVVQGVIYLLLFALPAIGVSIVFAGGRELSLLGLIDLPSPWVKDRELGHALKTLHEWMAHSLVALAALHAASALAHHFRFKDDTLRRMLPALGAKA